MESSRLHEREERGHAPGSVAEVAGIAWPIVVSMLSFTAMGVVDTVLVGWIGTTELAAVGLATTAVFFVNSFFVGVIHGGKVVAAQATGARDSVRAAQAGWAALCLAIPFGLLVAVSSFGAAELFAVIGGPPAVQAAAIAYFVIRVWGNPVWYAEIAMADYLQATGDTRTPMKVNLLVNGLNIGLDLVLIFGFGPVPALGIEGAAIATVIAQLVGTALMTFYFVRNVGGWNKPSMEVWREVFRLGLPMGVRYTLDIGSFMAFTAVLARLGEAELAAHQIALKVISLSFLPGHAISEAAMILVGQYYGARELDNARRAYRSALGIALVVMGVLGLLFWLVPNALLSPFRPDAEIAALGVDLLLIAALFQLFDAMCMVASGALNGVGDTRFAMVVSIVGGWLVMAPAAWFLAVECELGAAGAWWGMTLEILLLAAVLTIRWLGESWVEPARRRSGPAAP